jgi:putative transposase
VRRKPWDAGGRGSVRAGAGDDERNRPPVPRRGSHGGSPSTCAVNRGTLEGEALSEPGRSRVAARTARPPKAPGRRREARPPCIAATQPLRGGRSVRIIFLMPRENPSPWLVRHRPVHHAVRERLNVPALIFVTVCTARRKPILANAATHEVVRAAWGVADAWAVGRYVILPDHIHLFCAPRRDDVEIGQWVRYWKSSASRRWPRPEEHPIWQSDFWDTQLRHGESYDAKWDYVRSNPVRHGLVDVPEAWPFAGEMNELFWDGP